MLSGKWRPFCLSLNVLRSEYLVSGLGGIFTMVSWLMMVSSLVWSVHVIDNGEFFSMISPCYVVLRLELPTKFTAKIIDIKGLFCDMVSPWLLGRCVDSQLKVIIGNDLAIAVILTHWGRDEMDNILQMTFSNVFSSMKMFEFWVRCHWNLFLRVQLTIFQHWFR